MRAQALDDFIRILELLGGEVAVIEFVSAPISIPLFRHLHPQVSFFCRTYAMRFFVWQPLETGALETGSPSGIAGFSL